MDTAILVIASVGSSSVLAAAITAWVTRKRDKSQVMIDAEEVKTVSAQVAAEKFAELAAEYKDSWDAAEEREAECIRRLDDADRQAEEREKRLMRKILALEDLIKNGPSNERK